MFDPNARVLEYTGEALIRPLTYLFLKSRAEMRDRQDARRRRLKARAGNNLDRPVLLADPERRPSLVSPSLIETDFAELEDGTLAEMIEDPEDSSQTLLATYKDGEVSYARQLPSGSRVLVPIPRNTPIIKHLRLPRGVKPYRSPSPLLIEIHSFLSRCLDLEKSHCRLLAHFILSTWFIDRLSVAPYIALVGLPRSGKTTVLRVLSLLCRRALLTADITSAAFYQICDRLTPTLLIDETSTAGEKRKLFHLLRTGTTRDTVAFRKDQSFKTFGAKAISWIELPNDAALNSRCVLIPIHESHRTDFARTTDPEISQVADELQKQLLQFRFEKYKTLRLPKIPDDDQLHSRTRDLYEALALPVGHDTEACQWLAMILRMQQESNRDPLSPRQSTVLQVLFLSIHFALKKGTCLIGELTDWTNLLLQKSREQFRMNAREVGAVLTSLGFSRRERTNAGWVLWLNRDARRRVHELIAAYEIDGRKLLLDLPGDEPCEFCQSYRTVTNEHRERRERKRRTGANRA